MIKIRIALSSAEFVMIVVFKSHQLKKLGTLQYYIITMSNVFCYLKIDKIGSIVLNFRDMRLNFDDWLATR